jgi:CRISPR-associated protein Cmr4
MKTTFKPYLIECITNMHAGSGDTQYGIIDKQVQRDLVTEYPTIHASSLKGALREHCKQNWTESKDAEKISEIFGSETDDNKPGTHKFLNADLVALPIRCTHNQYVMALDTVIIEMVNAKAQKIIGQNIIESSFADADTFYGGVANAYAEDYLLNVATYKEPILKKANSLGNGFATLKQANFKQLAKNLPVLARNRVGEDKNLWYEEIVPHKTTFVTYIGFNADNDLFNKTLTNDLIQIGANASIGYGICKFYALHI